MIDRYKLARRVSLTAIIVNILLSGFKLFAGIIANSSAMIADAVESTSDILTALVVMISLKIAQKPEDSEHPYGHEKAEPIATKIIGIFLFAAGLGIGWKALESLIDGNTETPGALALYAAIITILVKELLFWYTITAAKRINSSALKADAWHYRSDALSSVATLAGIAAARLGFGLGDPLAALFVSIMIIKLAFSIYKKSVQELMDTSAPSDTVESIKNAILSVKDVKSVDMLKTRLHGNVIYADVDILVDNFISVAKGHDIACQVEFTVKSLFPQIKDIMVHVNPCSPDMTHLCSVCAHKCKGNDSRRQLKS